MLKTYFQDIFKTYKSGKPTEPSFYPDLKKLLEEFLTSKGVTPHVTIEERKTKSGKPDFVVRKGRGELVGYVEAKDISIEDLQTIENTDQIERYKKLPNFILTNYFDFWLWREGKWIKKVRVGMPAALKRVKVAPPPQNEDEFKELLDSFFSYYIPERKSAKTLAKEIADRAQLMPAYIIQELTDNQTNEIDRIYNAFKDYLITDLSKEDFADIYAQTITYGLFTARLHYPNKKGFDRFVASQYIPKNIQILHDTFSLISSTALPESLAWIVDDIAAVLANADIKTIKEELHTKKGADDPLVHFYETFLGEYDPKKRKSRGVYYTPLPIVSFITRSINILLKEKFGIKEGLAGDNVTLLDPAAGTLTFPAQSIQLAVEERSKQWGPGGIKSFIKDHILEHFHAFELLMAPYVIGHLKISLLLQELGYDFDIKDKKDRFKLYLTNTLDFDPVRETNLPFAFALSEEAKKAEKVKKEEEILVILGNPPYSVSSQNDTDFTRKELELYKKDLRDEKGKLTERNIQPLSDDYIKFIRFAHWRIDETGQGVVGMITNNSYLSGLIHRGMRKKLAESFDEIYILNLHGNSLIGETTPDGGKDENVFDIRQGVSIVLFVKTSGGKGKLAQVFYADLYGLRGDIDEEGTKYHYLWTNDIKTTKWRKLDPKRPQYFFVDKEFVSVHIWDQFHTLEEIFEKHTTGIKTHRDKFVIDFDKRDLANRIRSFSRFEGSDALTKSAFDISKNDAIDIINTKKVLKGLPDLEDLIIPLTYRPFDQRWVLFHPSVVDRHRLPLMASMTYPNLGLVVSRQFGGKKHFIVFVSNNVVEISSQPYAPYSIFPLYFNEDLAKQIPFEIEWKKPNLKEEFIALLNSTYDSQSVAESPGKQKAFDILPENIFYYIYAVLYSNVYRQKYEEFLKIDFPRIPFAKDYELFQKLAQFGEELVNLHLLRSPELGEPIAKFYGDGNNLVEKREYKDSRVYINESQYFEGVKEEVWNYYIGGYQVLDKWLKDRKDRTLSSEDTKHYCKIVAALQKTLELQNQVDKLYPEVEKELIKYES